MHAAQSCHATKLVIRLGNEIVKNLVRDGIEESSLSLIELLIFQLC